MTTREPRPTTALDAAARAAHRQALHAVSPRVQAQLAQRRHAVLRGEARRGSPRLRVAIAAFAALTALAVGLQLRPLPPEPAARVAAAGGASNPAPRAQATALDEDPEFYAWLASTDSQQLALE